MISRCEESVNTGLCCGGQADREAFLVTVVKSAVGRR